MIAHKLIIIKLGSQIVVTQEQSLEEQLRPLTEQIAKLKTSGHDVILVSSGAIGLGRVELKLSEKLSMEQKQAAAAVGQPALMSVYRELFSEQHYVTAQVLLTADDFSSRSRYLSIKDTFNCLLKNHAIPIVNENDCVATYEIKDDSPSEPSFGDNDRLSALLAVNLQADLLILLTNVDGLFDRNPEAEPSAKLIPLINNLSEFAQAETSGVSNLGRGGMKSKLIAASIASIGGVPTVIANGGRPEIITQILSDTNFVGTLITAKERPLKARKNWIGFASGYRGSIVINDCARQVILAGRSSLLAVGIDDVLGDFPSGQVIQIKDSGGEEIARGLSSVSSSEIAQIKGKNASEIAMLAAQIGLELTEIVIHKDQLVTTGQYAI